MSEIPAPFGPRMQGVRRFLDRDTLAGLWQVALDTPQRLARVDRLAGGSKKGVYRLTADDSSTVVLYVWDETENYWPSSGDNDLADPFADANGLDLFLAANAALADHDVRTPTVRVADATRTLLPSPFALVEDVRGTSLEALLDAGPRDADRALVTLGEDLTRMHSVRDPRIGKVANADREPRGEARTCERLVLDRALRHLGEAGSRVPSIAAKHGALEDRLRALASAVQPRTAHGLVHGELGPDHVLVDDQGAAVLIDIEGLMFFDIEWEHAFLEFRFGAHYEPLRRPDLDADRLALYRLALHLSLVAGPLTLLDGDFPDREGMLDIVDWNVARVLSLVAT